MIERNASGRTRPWQKRTNERERERESERTVPREEPRSGGRDISPNRWKRGEGGRRTAEKISKLHLYINLKKKIGASHSRTEL